MSYLIENGKVRGKLRRLPAGLPELLNDIAREAMRCQPPPNSLYQFIIDYLRSIKNTHEKGLAAKRIIDRTLRMVNEVIPTLCLCTIAVEKQNEICAVMEECFMRFLEQKRLELRKDPDILDFEDEMLEKLIERCHFSDEELANARPLIDKTYENFVTAYLDAHKNDECMSALYKYFVDREAARQMLRRLNESATTIQRHFRGYITRKKLFLDAIEKAEDDEELIAAAMKIQRCFRKYRRATSMQRAQSRAEDLDGVNMCDPVSNIIIDPEAVPDKMPVMEEPSDEQPEEVPKEEEKPKADPPAAQAPAFDPAAEDDAGGGFTAEPPQEEVPDESVSDRDYADEYEMEEYEDHGEYDTENEDDAD